MAKRTKTEAHTYLELKNWSISGLRRYSFGTFFTLKIAGASFYNLKLIPATANRDAFISMPQTKGKDGVYYDMYYVNFSPEDSKAIIEAIERKLQEKEEVIYG